VGVLAVTASLVAAPAAFAQQIGPTDDQYDSTLEVISQGQQPQPPSGQPGDSGEPGVVEASGPAPSADRAVGGLPFTGFEVIGMLAVAIALTGAGFAAWRASRDRSTGSIGSS
jgi:hypothetical protein